VNKLLAFSVHQFSLICKLFVELHLLTLDLRCCKFLFTFRLSNFLR